MDLPNDWLLEFQVRNVGEKSGAVADLLKNPNVLQRRFCMKHHDQWKKCPPEKFMKIPGNMILDSLSEKLASIKENGNDMFGTVEKNLSQLNTFWQVKVKEGQLDLHNNMEIKMYLSVCSANKVFKEKVKVRLPTNSDDLTKLTCFTQAALSRIIVLCIDQDKPVMNQQGDLDLEEYKDTEDEEDEDQKTN